MIQKIIKKKGKIMKQVLLLFSVFICFPCLSFAGNHPHAYGGIPSNSAYIERNAYIIQLDPIRKTPRWVAYHIKPEYLDTPPRENQWGKFRDDPDIIGEATEQDYKNQFNTWRNYAKGHLAPYFISGGDRDNNGVNAEAGDPYDAQTVYQILYMSNMAPQHHYAFNGSGGLWYEAETYIRDTLLKSQQKDVWVFDGCIYGPGSYDTIGVGVEVPPMFFKIVITEEDGNPMILAFLFPHQIKRNGKIQDFLVSVNIIEAMTGLDFFPDLNDEKIERRCTSENSELLTSYVKKADYQRFSKTHIVKWKCNTIHDNYTH